MNKNNQSTFILTAGLIVLIILTVVSVYNILPRNKESDSFYVKVEDDMSAKIESIESKNGKLDITTSGDAKEFCVKPTKSTPDINNICWKEIKNSTAIITVYQNKKYYIWIKDNKDKISSPMSINTKNEK